ncbi:MAG: DUF4272 domain-containing protein [Chitinophagaceae bacterium]
MIRILIAICALTFFSCSNNGGSNERPRITIPVEHIVAAKDQQERRSKSEAYCKSHNIPIYTNPNALFVDPEDSVTIRTQNEVTDRALALFYIGAKSEGLEQKQLYKIGHDFNINAKLTASEREYATTKKPTQQQNIDASWRYESLHLMLWALGFIDTLSYPNQICDVAGDLKIIQDLTEQQFKQKAKLRSSKEILDQADLILRLDWACVSAKEKKQSAPGNLVDGVVVERHQSLNWLINYLHEDWDKVTTDT